MKQLQIFTAVGASVSGSAPAGGSVAIANPAAAGGANALMLTGIGSGVLVRFANSVAFTPSPLSEGLADLSVGASAQIIVTDPAKVVAPFVIVTGAITLQAGNSTSNVTLLNT